MKKKMSKRRLAFILGLLMLMSLSCSDDNSDSSSDTDYIASFLTSRLLNRADGSPNPRITCTPGNKEARDYLFGELTYMGLKPGGDVIDGSPSFLNFVPGSVSEMYCPDGMANLIGIVPGTSKPDEYVMWVAHFDGPNNQGTSSTDGIGDTDNAYDNAAAVAVGLQLARYFKKNPPERSVVIFFTDGEEGWENVGEWLPGPNAGPMIDCENGPIPSYAAQGCADGDGYVPIGYTAWLQNPTIPLEQVKLAIGADPFGAHSVRGSEALVIIGANESPGLEALMKSVLPTGPSEVENLYVNSNAVEGFYTDVVSSASKYSNYCGRPGQAACIPAEGVPFVWLAQLGFQRYHGGMVHPFLGQLISDMELATSAQYWALDTTQSFDPAVLDRLYQKLEPAIATLASSPELDNITYASPTPISTVGDLQDNINSLNYSIDALAQGTPVTEIQGSTAGKLISAAEGYKSQYESALAGLGPDGLVNDPIKQDLVSFLLSLDFFANTSESTLYEGTGP